MVYFPHWPIPSSFGKREIDYSAVFARIKPVLEKLGNPHEKMPPIIHITGTNGKGSTASFLAEILKSSGLKVDVYTSPHLIHCNERIVLNGEKISDSYLYELVEEVRIASDGAILTFFESFTIIAFLAFSKSKSDVLIIEVGMGARFDATNIVDKKLATIITPISFDHTEYLGNSIEEIAFEKSYIMREKTPLIVGPQPSQAKKIIEAMAQKLDTPTFRYDQEFEIILDEENGNFDFKMKDVDFIDLPKPSLDGKHQYINAANAIACALTLPFTISENHVRQGLKQTSWPSRIEKVQNNLNKFFKNKESEIFIDGAHNQSGALSLARFILEEKQKTNAKYFVIFGFTKNKCKKEFLLNFKNVTDKAYSVRVHGESNPENAEIISEIGKEINFEIKPHDDLFDVVYEIANLVQNDVCKIFICGSLHLARDVKRYQIF